MIGSTNYSRWPALKKGETCGAEVLVGVSSTLKCRRAAVKVLGLLDQNGVIFQFLPCCADHARRLEIQGEAQPNV